MQLGRRPTPIITIESIELALKNLDFQHGGEDDVQPLENLILIDDYLQNVTPPSTEEIRSWALHNILVNLLTEHYIELRTSYGLITPEGAGYDETLIFIQQDFQTDTSDELKGWSILFHRYVPPIFGFMMKELAEIASINVRSLRRYQESAIRRLRHLVADAEAVARTRHKKMIMKSAIGEPIIIPLVGRDREVEILISEFDRDISLPILITGSYGIGKSALAAFVTNSLIESKEIDYLIWIKTPKSVRAIENAIWDNVKPYTSKAHWRDIIQEQQLVIVVDDIQKIDTQSNAWKQLLIELQLAFVILISPEIVHDMSNVQVIHLHELTKQASLQLIGIYNSNIDGHQIVQRVGGNPLALQKAAQIYAVSQAYAVDISLSELVKKQLSLLSGTEQYIWFLCATISQGVDSSLIHKFKNGREKFLSLGLSAKRKAICAIDIFYRSRQILSI